MIYVANDLHGVNHLISDVMVSISGMNKDDILVINGDGAGARGPIMNNVVKLYYEVRRGETEAKVLFSAIGDIIGKTPDIPQQWIYHSAHAGIFRKLLSDKYPEFAACMRKELDSVIRKTLSYISRAASEKGVKVLYLPGNGEIVTDDFIIDDIAVETTVTPDERYYTKLANEGFFSEYDVEYIPYGKILSDDTVVIGANLLDLCYEDALEKLREGGVFDLETISNIIVHYPPVIAPIGKSFSFWTPNNSDIERITMLCEILGRLPLEASRSTVYFGHIHLGTRDERMDALPSSMGFNLPDYRAVWVKPGSVVPVK